MSIPITIITGLFAACLTALVTLRGLRQQKRLGYLQSILQVQANRIRLQSFLSSVRFLVAINELFPDYNISEEYISNIGSDKQDKARVLLITIYTRERLYAIRNTRRKHDESMEEYEDYLYNLLWIESWRSGDVINQFKNMLLEHGESLSPGYIQFRKFVKYVKRYIVWCRIEPQFDMIFSVAPRIRKRIELSIRKSIECEEYSDWLEIEKQIYLFYQGKGW